MIDSFVIFSRSGTVLYYQNTADNNDEPPTELVNQFIETVFLGVTGRVKTGEKICSLAPSTGAAAVADTIICEWEEKSDRAWIAVVFYKAVLQNRLNYIRALLEMSLSEYCLFYDSVFRDSPTHVIINHTPPDQTAQSKFTLSFLALQKKAEIQAKQQPPRPPSSGNLSNLNLQQPQPSKATSVKKTVWHDGKQKVTAEAMASLDYSKPLANSQEETEARLKRELAEARAAYLPSESETPLWDEQEIELKDEDVSFLNVSDSDTNSGGWASSLMGLWDQVSGNKILALEDVQPICEQMKQQLVSKNVSHKTATEICNMVQTQLLGKRLKSFGRIQTAVRTSLESAIAKLLTPNRPVDVLRDVVSKRERQQGMFARRSPAKPYVIVFVGINGVGKSSKLFIPCLQN